MLFPDDSGLIARGIDAFKTTTGVGGFSIEEFENDAAQYENQYPGEGYQRAYDESLNRVFETYVAGILRDEVPLATLSSLVYSFDAFIMKPYMEIAKNCGSDIKIDINFKDLKPKTLKAFDDILDRIPTYTVMGDIYDRFDRKELTLDTVYADLKARKDTVPTKEDALKLVSCASYLEERLESRTRWQTFLNWYTALREYFAVKALKELAAKATRSGDTNGLEHEAETGNQDLFRLRHEVTVGLITAEAKITNEKIRQRAEFESVLDPEELDSAENDLDLGQIDDAFSLDDGDEPFLSDESDAEKTSITIEELLDEDTSPKSERVEEIKPISNNGISLN